LPCGSQNVDQDGEARRIEVDNFAKVDFETLTLRHSKHTKKGSPKFRRRIDVNSARNFGSRSGADLLEPDLKIVLACWVITRFADEEPK
jgi:hypothetical protein